MDSNTPTTDKIIKTFGPRVSFAYLILQFSLGIILVIGAYITYRTMPTTFKVAQNTVEIEEVSAKIDLLLTEGSINSKINTQRIFTVEEAIKDLNAKTDRIIDILLNN